MARRIKKRNQGKCPYYNTRCSSGYSDCQHRLNSKQVKRLQEEGFAEASQSLLRCSYCGAIYQWEDDAWACVFGRDKGLVWEPREEPERVFCS